MENKYDLVIFDWAGTTVDYGCFAPVQAFIEVFRHFGIEPTIEEVRKPMGMLKRDHIKTMLSMERISDLWQQKYKRKWNEQDVDSLYALFEEKLLSILDGFADVKPHVLEAVEELKKRNIYIGSTTGYTDKMMEIVVPKAKENGYEPDAWFSPDSVESMGRPYPYMIYRNMEKFHIKSVDRVMKVGDTISDIREGKNAGVYTVGLVEGSSQMALSRQEYENLSEDERAKIILDVTQSFYDAGADAVILNMGELPDLL